MKNKHSVSNRSVGGFTLLMRKVKGQWPDWVELTERLEYLRDHQSVQLGAKIFQNAQLYICKALGLQQQNHHVTFHFCLPAET